MPADRSRLPEIGPDPAFTFPAVARHRLSNGMALRTVEHRSVPVLTFLLHVEGGSGADPAGREGLVALAADMADEGTGSMTALDVAEALARIGGDYDVDVGPDAVVFGLTVPSRFAEQAADLFAAMVTRPSLREDDFSRVRQLRLDRLRQLNDLPPVVADRAFLRLVYGDHPYGHLPIGSDAALRAVTLDDVAALYATAFRPDAAALVMVGALSHDEMRRLAESAFGEWSASIEGPAPGRAGAGDVAASSPPRIAVVPRERAAQSELRIGQLSVSRNTPDYFALLVMNAVLGGQFVSRINLKLREEKGYTYGARTGFEWRRGPSPFSLQASVYTAATADAVSDALSEFDAIRGARPPSDHELSLAKASLTRGYPRNFETAQQVARAVEQLVLYDLPDTYFMEFVARVSAVTGADVTEAARRHLDPGRMTTLIVGDAAALSGSMAALGEPVILPSAM